MNKETKASKYLRLVKEFQQAHTNLVRFYLDEDDDELHLIAAKLFPFDLSLDDYSIPIKNWVGAIEYIINKYYEEIR